MSFARPHPPTREETIARRQAPRPAATVKPLTRGVMGGTTTAAAKPIQKLTRCDKVRQDIRDSARGEDCLMELPGVCLHDPAATIWSHARWPEAGKGGATKALDMCGCMACTACDQCYDGQRKPPAGWTREDVDRAWLMAHLKSLVRLAEKSLI